jgi:hypothetical protein
LHQNFDGLGAVLRVCGQATIESNVVAQGLLVLSIADNRAIDLSRPPVESGPIALDLGQVDFAAEPVAINLASRSPDLFPSIARGYGCRISADRQTLTVFVSVPRARSLLRDLSAGAPIAVVLTRPMSNKSLQIKGAPAQILALMPEDRDIMRAYGRAFAAEIRVLGYSNELAEALVVPVEEEALAVSFQIASLFDQTPGPRAGERLAPRP